MTGPDFARFRGERDKLLGGIARFLAGQDARTLDEIRSAVESEIDIAGPDALACLSERLESDAADWTYYPKDPLASRIHRVIADRLLAEGSALRGSEHVAAVDDRPVVIVSNHLSYSDANLLELLLQRSGGESLANRLTAIAGPKVYSSRTRRFSSLCFGTIKVPQSTERSSENAVMNTREVARAARRAIEIAHERLHAGEALLVFAEGARSRSAGMQRTLTGVARYLDVPGVVILPVGITGTEALFPIGDETIHPVRIVADVGRPIEAGILRERAGDDRRLMMDVVGLAIAGRLPMTYRGAYGDHIAGLDEARRLLREL